MEGTLNLTLHRFGSLESYLYTMEHTDTNKAFEDRYDGLASQRVSPKTSRFAATETWEEAQELLRNGYPEGLQQILDDKGGIPFSVDRNRVIRKDDFVGQRPNIAATLMGKPKTMIHRIKQEPRMKTATIYYNCYPVASVPASTMVRAGKNFMALVKHLENMGVRVTINLVMPAAVEKSSGNYNGVVPCVKVKDCKQPLNPLRLSYPLVHPSFVRRHLFRYIETSSLTNATSWTWGYGYPVCDNFGVTRFREEMRKNNITGKDEYFLDYSEAYNADSIEDMCKAMRYAI